MKRSKPLRRHTGLKRTSPLRSRRKPPVPELGRDEFKQVRHGICRGCGKVGMVRRHHVVYEQHVRLAGGNPWDTSNSLWVGVEGFTCDCHERHHSAAARIPVEVIPQAALLFAAGLLGEAAAADYVARYYRADVTVWRAA